MSNKQDLLLRLDSEFNDKGFKKAEDSARVLERELNKQEQAQRQLANLQMAAAKEQQRLDQVRLASMSKVGMGFTAVGLLAAAGLGVATKAAVDWESAWAGVSKTVDGTPAQMAALEEQLRGLARTLPATHTEIAGVAEAAGQLGVKARDIAGFTKTMIDLGVSTNLSAEEAATGLAQLGNVMGVLPSDAGRAGAALVALGNDGASTEADILAMSLRIAGAGKQIGLTEAQVMGFANALASMGIEAEAGGSGISKVMIDIAQSVENGGDKLDAFAQVAGMTTDQFATAFRTNAAGAVATFIEGLGRMQASGKSTFGVLDDLGLSEIRVRDTLLRASNAGDLLTKSIDLGSTAWEQNLALVLEANKRYETTSSRLKTARNELNDAAIDIGANVLPALAGVADRVGALGEAFHELPEPVKVALTLLGATVAVVGLVGGGALVAVPKIAAMNAALAATGARGAAAAGRLSALGGVLTGPFGMALLGATFALGAWLETQYKAQAKVKDLTDTLDTQTGALTENSRAWAVTTLDDEGVLEAAKKLGVSLDTITDAYLGNADAAAEVDAAVTRLRDGMKDPGLDFGKFGDLVGTRRDLVKVTETIEGGNKTLDDAKAAWKRKTEAMGQDAAASKDAATATDGMTESQRQSATAAQQAQQEINQLIKAVDGYGDSVNAALDATSGYEASLDAAAKAVEENGKTANKARTAINLHTEAGRANDKALREIAKSALEAATANFTNGKSVQAVTKDVAAARDQFVTMATKMGLSKTAANKLADQLGLTKDNVDTLNAAVDKLPVSKTTTVTVQTAEALKVLAALQTRINGLRGNDVRVGVRYVTTGQTGGGITKDSAQGNLFEYAGGGIHRPGLGVQQPQIRVAGGDGVRWAEKGAGPWEAFISGNPANHDRSVDMWWETGRRLGMAGQQQQAAPVIVKEGPTFKTTFEVRGDGAEPAVKQAMREFEFHTFNRM